MDELSNSRNCALPSNDLKKGPFAAFRYTQVALYRSQSPVNARKCLISIGIDFR